MMLYLRTDELTGTVQGVNWERSVPILALVPVEHSNWQDQVPNDATIQYCRDEVRSVQAQPAPNSPVQHPLKLTLIATQITKQAVFQQQLINQQTRQPISQEISRQEKP